MQKEFGKKTLIILFRFVLSLLIFGVFMTIVGYICDLFEYINLSNVHWIVYGVLKVSLASLIIVGSGTLVLHLIAWILDFLTSDLEGDKNEE